LHGRRGHAAHASFRSGGAALVVALLRSDTHTTEKKGRPGAHLRAAGWPAEAGRGLGGSRACPGVLGAFLPRPQQLRPAPTPSLLPSFPARRRRWLAGSGRRRGLGGVTARRGGPRASSAGPPSPAAAPPCLQQLPVMDDGGVSPADLGKTEARIRPCREW
jgi:hypothetical protein